MHTCLLFKSSILKKYEKDHNLQNFMKWFLCGEIARMFCRYFKCEKIKISHNSKAQIQTPPKCGSSRFPSYPPGTPQRTWALSHCVLQMDHAHV